MTAKVCSAQQSSFRIGKINMLITIPLRLKCHISKLNTIIERRDRAELLRSFLVFMHSFLRRQHIHYRIYVVEQVDSQPFNRAKLINIGAVAAMSAGYPCLIFHDVDLLPLRPANIYACSKWPRLMTSSTNSFRWRITKYKSYFIYLIAGISASENAQTRCTTFSFISSK